MEPDITEQITRAVKAELARRDLDGVDLVPVLGMGRNAVYSRLRHERAFDMAELSKITVFMGITMNDLLDSAQYGLRIAERATGEHARTETAA
ncbi:hypothetical protein ATY41_02855 [Leifsonia xyli subsp. xyli]|uniref:XRE family transcriptional regulator n=1 Tax=Leifsonia xyli subsp. xyli TaxID=59736 RepID=A0A1E2SK22_LEIXY|nr:hypothetical protein [Leifsonia xyli]ODA89998.1 hypothetical protein ATY41_02855 [Leifsonia xyli subsp. xyli]